MDSQALLRVYGALMWSLGKVVKSPEVIISGIVRMLSLKKSPLSLVSNCNSGKQSVLGKLLGDASQESREQARVF